MQQHDEDKTEKGQPQEPGLSQDAPVCAGEWVSCRECRGHGTVSAYSWADFEGPAECRNCNGGALWRYPSGVLALYPGGPFRGRDMHPERAPALAVDPSRSTPDAVAVPEPVR